MTLEDRVGLAVAVSLVVLETPTPFQGLYMAEERQMNAKVGLSNLPAWNGKEKTTISPLSEMAGFARLGDHMKRKTAASA